MRSDVGDEPRFALAAHGGQVSQAGRLASVLEGLREGRLALAASSPAVLDERGRALVGLGAAVALGASVSTYRGLVDRATAAGATAEECVGAFLAVAPVVGVARVVTGAPRIAEALGYDIDRALE